ncbi:MAG: plastocyanin/azurin family copper-binding protein [Pseudomonadota bacterium]|nr:plastocyanin/azurin family copper-binding protein [Pseudomonadota bacterium]
MRRRSLLLGPALGLIMASGLMTGSVAAETHQVEMKKFKFAPAEITVKVGDTVHWVNQERRQYHTVWFRLAGDPETVELFPGDTFDKTFEQPGEYPYVCGPHEKDYGMTGIVHVE